MVAPKRLIRRSIALKRQLIDFVNADPGLARLLRRHMNEVLGTRGRGSEGEDINVLDHFLLERRLPDGKTVVEHLVERHPELAEDERAMLLGWRDVVEGVFEVKERKGDTVAAFNLVDEFVLPAGKTAAEFARDEGDTPQASRLRVL